ncbi:MAG: ATP-grasp domain-containing protein [Candidatus Altiarchaeota archaeon]
MNVLLVEHATSFGFDGVSPGILTEGFSMLRLLCRDFSRAGDRVHVALNSSLGEYGVFLDYDELHLVDGKSRFEALLDSLEGKVDSSYVLAPDHLLAGYVRGLEDAGLSHMNSSPGAVEVAADKLKTHKVLVGNGIPTPRQVNERSFPFIVKPSSGSGCENTRLVKSTEEYGSPEFTEGMMCQAYVEGVNASVILAAAGGEFKPVCLNEQVISMSGDGVLSYGGGFTPLDHPLRDESFRLAVTCCEAIPGLCGLVGVDLVLSERPCVIEVNPRLVTSALGLSRVSGLNMADLIKGRMPGKTGFNGVSFYSHIKAFNHVRLDSRSPGDFMGMDELWAPPMRMDKTESLGFAVVWGKTRGAALDAYASLCAGDSG